MLRAHPTKSNSKGKFTKVPGMCEVPYVDCLFCSTSCKDFSRANPQANKDPGLLQEGVATKGVSNETFFALVELMDLRRPDMLIWENVSEVAREVPDRPSHLDHSNKWHGIGYQSSSSCTNAKSFGLPQNRERLVALAANVRDPRTLKFIGPMSMSGSCDADADWALDLYDDLFEL